VIGAEIETKPDVFPHVLRLRQKYLDPTVDVAFSAMGAMLVQVTGVTTFTLP
jgi:hypothetical protein